MSCKSIAEKLLKFQEEYGWEGYVFAGKIKDMIEFYKEIDREWELKVIHEDSYTLVIALINYLGVTLYTFSKKHKFYVGSFSLNSLDLEEILNKSNMFWEREPKCLESNSV